MPIEAKTLFQLQTELIDGKVEMATIKAIDRVLDRIDTLQKDMDARFTVLGQDMVAVKTRLGMNNETQSLLRAKLIDYAFKGGWLIAAIAIGSVSATLVTHLRSLF